MSEIKLIVGLGNPGPNYKDTRHNAGVWWIDALLDAYHQSLQIDGKILAQITKIEIDNRKIFVLVPSQYMNESGTSIRNLCQFYKIKPEEVLIAHDELDLPPGTIRLKKGGGHGGHNGLRDTINKLQSKEFYRLRIGIGHPGHRDDVSDYVLRKPSGSDRDTIKTRLSDAIAVLPKVCQGQFEKAMTQLHTQE